MAKFRKLKCLKNRHHGERAVIVCNGPSLNRMDLGFLRNEIVIGLNKIFLGFEEFDFYPNYYVAVNRKVIEQSVSQIKSMDCVKFISYSSSDLIPSDDLTYYVQTERPIDRFSRDISQGVHEGWTVTYVALQIAYYLGFKEIIIIGMDHRYEYTGAPNESRKMSGPDYNHFSPDYFRGQTWDNPDLFHSEESYRIARAEFEKDGRRIIDATLDGACTVFEKADYREVFGLNVTLLPTSSSFS
ncbi:6-hydroxymethylpterin diphosphokinase MptE-like protein [Methylomarinovum caldicuralii]|nr:6-hydroxymethylpterin diphosphokinase MptE-like protein [Methylomarinovum caldicuralii]